jgi:hypothetical protein
MAKKIIQKIFTETCKTVITGESIVITNFSEKYLISISQNAKIFVSFVEIRS